MEVMENNTNEFVHISIYTGNVLDVLAHATSCRRSFTIQSTFRHFQLSVNLGFYGSLQIKM